MAHQYLGGSVPFSGDALFYRLAVEDAADAIVHALESRITGVHNLTHAEVPPTNAALFDAISAAQDLPALVYRDEIASPHAADLGRPAGRDAASSRAGRTTPPRSTAGHSAADQQLRHPATRRPRQPDHRTAKAPRPLVAGPSCSGQEVTSA